MFASSPKTKISKQPSLYPSLVFHIIRTSQFISSAIVLSILSYFVYYLHLDNLHVPWTFILVRRNSLLIHCAITECLALASRRLDTHHLLPRHHQRPPLYPNPSSESESVAKRF